MNNGEPVKYKPSHVVSDCMFYDADNKGVAAYLLVDDDGCLCELDLWKGGELEILSLPSSTQISSKTSQWVNSSSGGEHALAFALRALTLTQHHL